MESFLPGYFFRKISQYINPKNEFLFERQKKNVSDYGDVCYRRRHCLSANVPLSLVHTSGISIRTNKRQNKGMQSSLRHIERHKHKNKNIDYVHTVSFSLAFYIVLRPQGIRKQMKTLRKRHRVHIALERKLRRCQKNETGQLSRPNTLYRHPSTALSGHRS